MIRVARWLMKVGEWLQIQSITFAWKFASDHDAFVFTNKYLRPFGKELFYAEDLLKYPRSALKTPPPPDIRRN